MEGQWEAMEGVWEGHGGVMGESWKGHGGVMEGSWGGRGGPWGAVEGRELRVRVPADVRSADSPQSRGRG